ncbi:MAG: non-canonical purine NTP pyrophosphatase [Clostridia bacterium]|nr:non-canonical purine NTP pyrophosphatase [Clostridia bacterium]MDD4734347.1 non-canonical purine NTP pyrophosphatase [Bacilli bacterium]
MEIVYVTGNWAKIASAKQVLEPLGFTIKNIKMDTIEIQSDSIEDVAKYSAKNASDKLKCDVLKNDSGLVIPSLKGFPGPYTHYADDTIGEDGILKLMDGIEDREAYFVEVLAYCKYGEEPVAFICKTEGTIAFKKSGTYGWSWDFIFIPKGQDKTLGNFEDEERFNLWNNTAYIQLADYLKNN